MSAHASLRSARVLVISGKQSVVSVLANWSSQHGLTCENTRSLEQLPNWLDGGNHLVIIGPDTSTATAMEALSLLQSAEQPPTIVVLAPGAGAPQALEYIRRGASDVVVEASPGETLAALDRAFEWARRRADEGKAQGSIRRARQELELTLDAVPDPILVLDNKCRILRANRAVAQLASTSPLSLVGEHCYEILDREADGCAGCPHRASLKSGKEERGEIHEPRSGRTFQALASPLAVGGGAARRSVLILRSHTDLKWAEEELQRVKRALQIVGQCNEAIIRVSSETDLMHKVCDVLVGVGGYRLAWVGSAEHDEKKTVRPVARAGFDDGYVSSLDISWADNKQGHGPAGTAIRTGRPCVVRNTSTDPLFLPWRDKAARRGYASAIGLPLGAGSRVFGVLVAYAAEPDAFDNEEVKLLTRLADDLAYGLVTICGRLEHLRADEERTRLSLAVEQASESIVITETDGRIVYVNPAFERATGYDRKEVIGKQPSLLKSGKHSPNFYRGLWNTLLRGGAWSGHLINRRKDGSLYEVEATISPVRDLQGRLVNFVAVHRDVTRERQLEQQLRQSQKMEAVGRLAGGIAHDFNNLLTAINGYGELLFSQTTAEPLRRYSEEIIKAGNRAAQLTRQLLAFSRRQVLEPQVLDMNAVVAQMGKILQRVIGEDIELETVPADGLWPVRADPGQVGQVILNLVVNARDAMPQGGRIVIATANREFKESNPPRDGSFLPGPYVVLSVSDTGCGIGPEAQGHIFEPFFTTKEPGKGTGLGLATVYGISKQSGGSIWFESEAGRGTKFTFCLPRVEDVCSLPAKRKVEANSTQGSETVLVVEDDEPVRTFVRGVLESQGYKVLVSQHGMEALVLAEQHRGPLHLLLTDVVMPAMSGPQLAGRLTALRHELKVLYMSGYADDAVVRHGVLGSDVAYLQKPFSAEALSQKVRGVLDSAGIGTSAGLEKGSPAVGC